MVFKTGIHKQQTESEVIHLELPKETAYVRISSITSQGSSNNHSFWANTQFINYKNVSDKIIPAESDSNGLVNILIIVFASAAVIAILILLIVIKRKGSKKE